MLYREHPVDTFTLWQGQPIDGIAHPRSIAYRWTEAELAAVGLYKPIRPTIPSGKRKVSETVQRVGNEVKFVYVLEDAPEPTSDAINDERDRRIGMPLQVNIPGVGAFPIDMTQQSRQNINGLSTLALVKKGMGDDSVMVNFRDATNTNRDLTPDQVIAMGAQVAGWIDHLYKKSWAIKEMDPVPADFDDNEYWL